MSTVTKQDVITRVATYPKPIERVWAALTEPQNLSRWMSATVSPYTLTPGEVMTMTWENETNRVVIETVDPPHTFAWRWIPGMLEDPTLPLEEQAPLTTVTFTLESVPGGTRLTMNETGFAAFDDERYAKVLEQNTGGWGECFAALERVVMDAA